MSRQEVISDVLENLDSNGSDLLSTSNTESSSLKSSVDLNIVNRVYSSLEESKMWRLKSGKVVEKQMNSFAMSCRFEHPCHSLILDVDDPVWIEQGYFTQDEMNEIRSFRQLDLPEAPENMTAYLKSYEGKCTLDSIFEAASHKQYHPLLEPDMNWTHQTILKGLNLLFYKYLPLTDNTEADIMHRVWGFVQEAFDESEFNVRCGEKASTASSARRNSERTIAGLQDISRKIVGQKVDMIVRFVAEEFACAEAGRDSNGTTKELVEGMLKCPKSLRDMIFKLATLNPSEVHDIVTFGFVFMGLKMTCLTMDCPAGYVCRLQRLGPILYPESEQTFVARITSLILTVWRIKAMMKRSLAVVQNEKAFIPSFKQPKPQNPLPPSYYQCGRKRKATESSRSAA
ncbi:hypothetical protein EC973_001524 [Apophysomyces ossiformis]|uniref:Uncharacterized protein n=1 Tax=Apophysomyces ossiformis TaxID=679940 RepID=A0A8H7BP59_9FUNG|nr:hypothetical protein EC973_001524 [Apophysomyces ossiformis]